MDELAGLLIKAKGEACTQIEKLIDPASVGNRPLKRERQDLFTREMNAHIQSRVEMLITEAVNLALTEVQSIRMSGADFRCCIIKHTRAHSMYIAAFDDHVSLLVAEFENRCAEHLRASISIIFKTCYVTAGTSNEIALRFTSHYSLKQTDLMRHNG